MVGTSSTTVMTSDCRRAAERLRLARPDAASSSLTIRNDVPVPCRTALPHDADASASASSRETNDVRCAFMSANPFEFAA